MRIFSLITSSSYNCFSDVYQYDFNKKKHFRKPFKWHDSGNCLPKYLLDFLYLSYLISEITTYLYLTIILNGFKN